MAMVGVGTGAYLLLSNRTERLSMEEFAEKLCTKVIAPHVDHIQAYEDEVAWDVLDDFDESSPSPEDREVVPRYVRGYVDRVDSFYEEIGSFNDSYRLQGSDGDELHDQMTEMVDAVGEATRDLREFMTDVDPADADEISASFRQWNDELSASLLSSSGISHRLHQSLGSVELRCATLEGWE